MPINARNRNIVYTYAWNKTCCESLWRAACIQSVIPMISRLYHKGAAAVGAAFADILATVIVILIVVFVIRKR